jgi:HEAT repeat protein
MQKMSERVKLTKAKEEKGIVFGASRKGNAIKVIIFYVFLFVWALIQAGGCSDLPAGGYGHRGDLTGEELKQEATEVVREALGDEDPRVRVNAVEVVAATGQIRLMPKVEKLLRDEFVPVRFAAALAVGTLEYSFASERIERLLEDPDENVRIAAAYAKGRLGSESNLELFRKAIASEDQTVRANAALLLGKSGDRAGLKFLYWALQHKDSDDKVRFQAAEAIAMLGDERIYPKLWTMLISTYADDRVMGVMGMGALGSEQAKNALITMLDDDILEVRLAAAEQLGKLGDASGEPEVLDVFRKNLTDGMDKGGRERVLRLAALAIGQIGTAGAKKWLPELLEDESKFVRIAAAKAVFQVTMNR